MNLPDVEPVQGNQLLARIAARIKEKPPSDAIFITRGGAAARRVVHRLHRGSKNFPEGIDVPGTLFLRKNDEGEMLPAYTRYDICAEEEARLEDMAHDRPHLTEAQKREISDWNAKSAMEVRTGGMRGSTATKHEALGRLLETAHQAGRGDVVQAILGAELNRANDAPLGDPMAPVPVPGGGNPYSHVSDGGGE